MLLHLLLLLLIMKRVMQAAVALWNHMLHLLLVLALWVTTSVMLLMLMLRILLLLLLKVGLIVHGRLVPGAALVVLVQPSAVVPRALRAVGALHQNGDLDGLEVGVSQRELPHGVVPDLDVDVLGAQAGRG